MKNILISTFIVGFIVSLLWAFNKPPVVITQARPAYEYQVVLEDNFIHIENNGRYVGSLPYDKIGKLDSLFISDNE